MPTKRLAVKDTVPLALLYGAPHTQIEGRTRLQKLVFLTQEALAEEGVDTHEFKPYKYGPFSKRLIERIDDLQQLGLLEREQQRTYGGSEKYVYNLTPIGKRTFEQNLAHSSDAGTTPIVVNTGQTVVCFLEETIR